MRNRRTAAATCLGITALFFGQAVAQDSVSQSGCLSGDSLIPWADASDALGSEQCNSYVVDAFTFLGSWGQEYTIAPISKTSKTSSGFFGSLMSAQGISRDMKLNVLFPASEYAEWQGAGQGVNNDPGLNQAPGIADATGIRGHQLGAVFAEFSGTDTGADYNGIIANVINIDPSNPKRFYVQRIVASVSGCDESSELSNAAAGSIDADGNVTFRTDDFGVSGTGSAACNLGSLNGNNIFIVDSLARDCDQLNVISPGFPNFGFDAGATKWVVRNDNDSHSTPGIMPQSVAPGGLPIYIGVKDGAVFVRGADNPATADQTHLGGLVNDNRGGLSYSTRNFGLVNSTHGMASVLADLGTGLKDTLLIWGLDGSANVTGSLAATLPATGVTDNADGFQSLAGANEFDHYHSQVFFRGGNGQVALGTDASGNLLAAAEVDHPDTAGSNHDWGTNYIAVVRIDPNTGAQSWTMAGWNDGLNGKKIRDSFGGNIIGQMIPLNKFSVNQGPSVSAPMMDAAGNVYFLSAIEMCPGGVCDGTGQMTIGLIRAVYDEAAFLYELELVMKLGDQFTGLNSNRDYIITDLRLADANSIDSASAWSQNISGEAHLGLDPSCFTTEDSRNMGGIVLAAEILYDVDMDGDFEECTSDPTSLDEDYRVLLHIGAGNDSGLSRYGDPNCPGGGGITPVLNLSGYPAASKDLTLSIDAAYGGPGALAVLFFGAGQSMLPAGGGCFLLAAPLLPPQITLPLFGTGVGDGSISLTAPLPAITPPGLVFTLQAFTFDPNVPRGFAGTNGAQIITQL